MALLDAILAWSQSDLKPWQQDALRRLFQHHELTDKDHAELAELLMHSKGVRGSDAPLFKAEPLAAVHLPVATDGNPPVLLTALHSIKNVNRLASAQTLRFGARGVTVIYGDNGAGKSGYSRVLKTACRARVQDEPILDNAHKHAFLHDTPEALFAVEIAGAAHTAAWKATDDAPAPLSSVAVLDTRCARAYADQEGELIFSPCGLDVVHNLAGKVFPAVEALVKAEQEKLQLSDVAFHDLKVGNTPTATFLKGLTHKTSDEALAAALEFSHEEEVRLQTLTSSLAERTPADKAKSCREQAKRLRHLVKAMQTCVEVVNADVVTQLKDADNRLRGAEQAEALAAEQLRGESTLLPGTGEDTWRTLFVSAQAFMEAQHLNHEQGSPCPLCQTQLSTEAAKRMQRFAQFVADDASERASAQRQAHSLLVAGLSGKDMDWLLDEATCGALQVVDDGWLKLVEQLKTELVARKHWLLAAMVHKEDWAAEPPVRANPFELPEMLAQAQEAEASTLEAAQDPEARATLQTEAAQLTARQALRARQAALTEYLSALRLNQALTACLVELKTKPISDKAGVFASEAVTTQLGEALNAEFLNLDVQRLHTTLKTRNDKGKTKLKLVLDLPGATRPEQVLSEGEQRVIAIASFFAELAVSNHTGAAVFDDPVSSLDHVRRQRVAKRLVTEAQTRQVIVFTHDSVFLAELMDAVKKLEVEALFQHLTYTPTSAGIVNDGLPWHHEGYKSRLDALGKLARDFGRNELTMDNEQAEESSRSIYGKLRQVVERVVEDMVFCGVLRRYNDYVRVGNIGEVVGLTSEECKPLIDLYNIAGDILDGHDKGSARQYSAPNAAECLRDIVALEAAIQVIQDRKKAVKQARATLS